ncbi:MAG TPA: carboxypeptidase regulatory-like domain-containing protein [Verrucomicrobiae bacterium]|nr:carboxypeptidase regulatory-like domain-containing protein [Verrucomicrobiae bacterium]
MTFCRQKLGFSAVFLFVLLSSATAVRAQTPDTATLLGHVVDQSHAPVPGAVVTAKNTLNGLEREATTNEAGAFSIAGLPIAGNYDISVRKKGFAEANLSGVTLAGGITANLHLQLNVAGGHSQIVVTGPVGDVRTDEPQLGDHLSATQAQETPLLNRRITYLPLLDAANRPAINQGDVFMNEDLFTTNGTGRRQTWFEVDGSNGVDAWGRQTIFSNVPLDAVQELTILTNAFSAEYGFTAGSVVNIVTKSGGNKFHGDLLGLWRPADTSASLSGFTTGTATSGNDVAGDSLRQTAASLSGPVGSDGRTQFFASGEYSWENRSSPITSPLEPGIFVGRYRGWLALFRLDHQINGNNNLFFRSNVDSFVDTNPNGIVGGNSLPSVDRVFKRRTYSELLGETAQLGGSFVNEVRLQFQLASPITQFVPVVDATQFSVPITSQCAGGVACGTFTSGTSQSALLMNRQYEADDTVSSVHGRHTIRFGADVIHAHNGGDSKEFGGPIYLGQFVYNVCAQAASVCESPAYLDDINNVQKYTQSYGNANYTVDDTLWSLFVQDDFRVRSDLTVNLGLRYARQTFTDSNKDIAPRVGFAYNLRGDAKTVIRGGFGIYYSQVVDNSEANYALTGPTGVFNYTATPGQVGFPASVSDAPLPSFPPGAVAPLRSLYIRPGQSAYLNQFFPTSVLIGYPNVLLNPYTEQWTFGLQRELAPEWILSADYVGSHTLKINRPLDVDPPAPFVRTMPNQFRGAAPNASGVEQCIPNPAIGNTANTPLSTCAVNAANATRPLWIYDSANGITPAYSTIQSDVNDGFAFYNALDLNLSHRFSHGVSLLASYTWSHAIDNVDPDIPSQNPNDPNFTGAQEKGNAIYDQRNRFVLSGFYTAPWKFRIGGIATLASGLPYNFTTGTTNSGDTGATTDRPVINGAVVGRNAGHGRPIYSFDPFIERPISFAGDRVQLDLRAEAFNVFNHPNFVGFSGTYGNAATPGTGFGLPLAGITNQLPARSLQFSAKVSF